MKNLFVSFLFFALPFIQLQAQQSAPIESSYAIVYTAHTAHSGMDSVKVYYEDGVIENLSKFKISINNIDEGCKTFIQKLSYMKQKGYEFVSVLDRADVINNPNYSIYQIYLFRKKQ